MNIYEQLDYLSKDLSKEVSVKNYLLDCAKIHVGHRSAGTLTKALSTAKKCLKGFGKWQKLYDLEWVLEAEAFEFDHYICGVTSRWPRISKKTRRDLVKIRLKYKLNHAKLLIYLRDLAYVIDSVFVYVAFPTNGIPGIQFEKFMCESLFRKYFGANT